MVLKIIIPSILLL